MFLKMTTVWSQSLGNDWLWNRDPYFLLQKLVVPNDWSWKKERLILERLSIPKSFIPTTDFWCWSPTLLQPSPVESLLGIPHHPSDRNHLLNYPRRWEQWVSSTLWREPRSLITRTKRIRFCSPSIISWKRDFARERAVEVDWQEDQCSGVLRGNKRLLAPKAKQIWKLLTEIKDLHLLMDTDNFLCLKS